MQISLKEHVAFETHGAYFLVRIKTLHSVPLTREEYAFIRSLDGQESIFATADEQAMLDRLGLIDNQPESAEERRALFLRRGESIIDRALPFSSIELMVSQRCNMRCTYCFGCGGEYADAGMMETSTAFHAIDRMFDTYSASGKATQPYIMFFGGEPLMNFALIKRCVSYCEERFGRGIVGYSISTNGILADRETMDWLNGHDFSISFSFDGPYQDQNRPLMDGADSYAMIAGRIREAIDRYGSANCLGIHYADQGRADMVSVYEGFERLNYKTNVVIGCPTAGTQADGCLLEYEEKAQALPELAEKMIAAIRLRDSSALCRLMRDEEYKGYALAAIVSPAFPKELLHCNAGRGRVCVDIRGRYFPCHCFVGIDRYAQGSQDAGYFSGSFARHLHSVHKECAACMLRYACAGGCMAACSALPEAAAMEEPIFYVPDAFCRLQKQKFMLHPYIYWSLTEEDRAWAMQNA